MGYRATEEDMVDGVEFGAFWGNSLYSRVIEKSSIVEDFVYTNDVVCISADAGVGKSLFLLQLLCNLTTGEPFLGTYKIPRPCNVCYLQTEGDRGETIDRIKAMCGGMGIDNSRWVHINLAGICLNTEEGKNKLKDLMLAPGMRYDVLMIDPLYTTVKGSMSKDEVATDWIRNMREIKELFKNCAVFIAHHLPKDNYVDGKKVGKTMFGSVMWRAYVNYSYQFTKKDGKHTLTVDKKRNDKIGFDHLDLKLLEPFPLKFIYADEDATTSKNQVKAVIVGAGKPLSAKEIIEKTGISKATVFRVLKLLMKGEGVVKLTDHNKTTGYEYRDKEE